jgi:hypothetical protein
MEEKLKKLEEQFIMQRIFTLVFATILLLVVAFGFGPKDPNIIRTQGIIIVDEKGNDRILIGAPIPHSESRVRTNFEKASKAWAGGYDQNFASWYNQLDHTANGIVILDENGFDRVALGNTIPDPNIGQRMGASTGLLLNDEQGFERSAYGVLNVEGKNRVVLGLDTDHGTEGLVLGLLEDGTTGMFVSSARKNMFLGNAPGGSFATNLTKPFFGIMAKDSTATKIDMDISAN